MEHRLREPTRGMKTGFKAESRLGTRQARGSMPETKMTLKGSACRPEVTDTLKQVLGKLPSIVQA